MTQHTAPAGFWERDSGHAPLPRTPMTTSIIDEGPAMRAACEDFGLLVTMRVLPIGGWLYGTVEPVGAPPERPAPPGWLLPWLIRLSPAASQRMKRCKEVIRTDFAGTTADRWYAQVRPALDRRIGQLRDADVSTMDDHTVVRQSHQARQLCVDGLREHFLVVMAHLYGVAELGLTCQELLGWDQTRTMQLLAGLSVKTTEPTRALSTVSSRQGRPDFAESLESFQRSYGIRSVCIELAERTLAEVPGLTAALLRDEASLQYEEHDIVLADQRKAAAAQARETLAGTGLAAFDRALSLAEKAYPLREDNVFYAIDGPIAVARRVVLEIGRRLVERDQLADVDDVFFVTLDDAGDALLRTLDLREKVDENRKEHLRVLEHPGPPSYGRDPGPPPSTKWLPADVRRFTDAMQWGIDKILEAQQSGRRIADAPNLLTGVAASKGSYRGKVRLIESEVDFERLARGEVLVCPSTRPSWSMLFPLAGAIVTDSGGTLSHPAIIAREYGIPAVVATGCATTVLRDGQIVVVDGDRGLVEIEASR